MLNVRLIYVCTASYAVRHILAHLRNYAGVQQEKMMSQVMLLDSIFSTGLLLVAISLMILETKEE